MLLPNCVLFKEILRIFAMVLNGIFHISFSKALLINRGETTRGEREWGRNDSGGERDSGRNDPVPIMGAVLVVIVW